VCTSSNSFANGAEHCYGPVTAWVGVVFAGFRQHRRLSLQELRWEPCLTTDASRTMSPVGSSERSSSSSSSFSSSRLVRMHTPSLCTCSEHHCSMEDIQAKVAALLRDVDAKPDPAREESKRSNTQLTAEPRKCARDGHVLKLPTQVGDGR